QAPSQLPKKTADRMNLANSNSSGLHQVSNSTRSKSKEVIWLLMLFPHVRNDEVNHSARLQHSSEFFDDTTRQRSVFQHDNREDVIEGAVRKRQFFETSDSIQARVVPRWISLREIDPDIFGVRKQVLEPALTGTGIEHTFAVRYFGGDAPNKRF